MQLKRRKLTVRLQLTAESIPFRDGVIRMALKPFQCDAFEVEALNANTELARLPAETEKPADVVLLEITAP